MGHFLPTPAQDDRINVETLLKKGNFISKIAMFLKIKYVAKTLKSEADIFNA